MTFGFGHHHHHDHHHGHHGHHDHHGHHHHHGGGGLGGALAGALFGVGTGMLVGAAASALAEPHTHRNHWHDHHRHHHHCHWDAAMPLFTVCNVDHYRRQVRHRHRVELTAFESMWSSMLIYDALTRQYRFATVNDRPPCRAHVCADIDPVEVTFVSGRGNTTVYANKVCRNCGQHFYVSGSPIAGLPSSYSTMSGPVPPSGYGAPLNAAQAQYQAAVASQNFQQSAPPAYAPYPQYTAPPAQYAAPSAPSVFGGQAQFCVGCGAHFPDASARFCQQCGKQRA